MIESDAAKTLSALAHPERLRAFRLLISKAPEGLSAGEVSATLGIAPSLLTFHLGVLRQAGLVQSHRRQRSVIYVPSLERMQSVLEYLMNDCCDGDPAVCGFLSNRG